MAGYARQACRPTSPTGSPITIGKNVSILFIGTPQDYHIVNQVVHSVPLRNDSKGLTIQHVHVDEGLNWFEGECRRRLDELLRDRMDSENVLLPCAAAVLAATPPEAIASLKDFAVQLGKLVILVAHAAEIEDLGHIAALVDDTLICDLCEPEPGLDFAWTLESSNAKPFHADGRGKLMQQISVCDGKFQFRASAFVSASRLDRVIWYLAAEGYERAVIANIVGLSVDEVDERLARLRPPRREHVPKGYRKRYDRLFDFSSLDR